MVFYNDKSEVIRKLLLKSMGKNPDLFSYYVAIQEAKELLGDHKYDQLKNPKSDKPIRILGDC